MIILCLILSFTTVIAKESYSEIYIKITDATTALKNNNQTEAKKIFSEVKNEFEKVKNICKEAQKQALRELDVFADKAGKGLSSWGLTFKYILSKSNTVKSISRDFEQITTKMIDAISLTMREFLVTEISDIIDSNMDIGKENIIYLLKYNKSDIEKYIEDRKQILRNTNSDIQMMEKVMVSINKYKNIIKEIN